MSRDRQNRFDFLPRCQTDSRRLAHEQLDPRHLLAADASVAFAQLESAPLIGETVEVRLEFDNLGDTEGYGPYIDFVVPTRDTHETGGLSYVPGSANYLGQQLSESIITFDDQGLATHRFATDENGQALVLTGNAGDQLVIIELPFGSFVSDQPAASIDFRVEVDQSAEVGEALEIVASSGFRFGEDPLDNPNVDPALASPTVSLAVSPSLVSTQIEYLGAESETATGENHVRSYRVSVDVAEGAVIEDLVLDSRFDLTHAFLELRDVSWNTDQYSIDRLPIVGSPSADNQLILTLPDWQGTDGIDGSFVIDFFIPERNAEQAFVIDPHAGTGSFSAFTAVTSGDWVKQVDSEDTTVSFTSTPVTHTLENEVLAVQQSVRSVGGQSLSSSRPGDVVEYAVQFQVSDYAALTNLELLIDLANGTQLVDRDDVKIQLNGINGVEDGVWEGSQVGLEAKSNGAGNLAFSYDVSAELKARGLEEAIYGGLTDLGSGRGVSGTIRYQAVILDEFQNDVASNDQSVDEGDLFRSAVVAEADTIDQTTNKRTRFSTSDDSSSTFRLAVGELTTEVYAINGAPVDSNSQISAGDLVTFRISRDVHHSDIENFQLRNFLPKPVFAVDNLFWSGENSLTENSISLTAGDTFHSLFEIMPTLDIDESNNGFKLNYGSLDSTSNQSSRIDLLVTVAVDDQPIADGMWLTSLSSSLQSTSNASDISQDAIASIQYARPVVELVKGVIDADNPNAQLGNSHNEDVRNVDAGDTIRFQLRLENTGSSEDGAFNVRFRDTIPAGLEIATAGLNLSVTDGNGRSLGYIGLGTGADADLFAEGIELRAPVLSADSDTDTNIVFVQYDLEVTGDVRGGERFDSDATVFHYAAQQLGENFVASEISDGASTQIAKPSITHQLIETDQAHTADNNVVIGETATLRATIQLPEAAMHNAQLQIKLPRGVAINQLIGLQASNGIEFLDSDLSDILDNAEILDIGNNARNAGRVLLIDFGDIRNHNRQNAELESIEVLYSATITNDPDNDVGDGRKSTATWSTDLATVSTKSNRLKIVEPQLTLTASSNQATMDAGDQVTLFIDIDSTNHRGADAFDVLLRESFPNDTNYVANSLRWISGLQPNDLSDTDGNLQASWSSFEIGASARLAYDVLAVNDVHAGEILTGNSKLTWSSLAGDPAQIADSNPLAVERTGDPVDSFDTTNDYLAVTQNQLRISPADVTITLVESSFAHTDGNQITIGEWSRYNVTVTVPEGRHDLILDVSDRSIDGRLALDSLELSAIGANLSGEKLIVGSVVQASEDGTLTFDLGQIQNASDNQRNSDDQLTFSLLAQVEDRFENEAQDILAPTATVDFRYGNSSASERITVVEPTLSLTQTLSNQFVDAGETIDVTLVIEHESTQSSLALEFDLATQLANHGLELVVGSVEVNQGHIVSGNQTGDESVRVSVDSISHGNAIEVRYQATVRLDATPGDTYQLPTSITWASAADADARTYRTDTLSSINVNSTSLGGWVFVDANQDGNRDDVDFGLGGVTVALTGVDYLGNSVDRTINTDANGRYQFDGLRPGDYTIAEGIVEFVSDGLDHAGEAGGTIGQDVISNISIATGSSGLFDGYLFTESPLSWISGTVFVDENEDQHLGQDEDGIEGINLFLTGTTDEGETVSRTATTNERGFYVFGHLAPGTYQVVEGVTDGYLDANEEIGTLGGAVGDDMFADIVITATEPGERYNFGEYVPAELRGQIYLDYDRDDTLDRYDGLIANVVVKLSGRNDLGETVTASSVTDEQGFYSFSGLRPGEYAVTSAAIDGLESSISNVGYFLGKYGDHGRSGYAAVNGFENIRLTAGAIAVNYNVGHVDPHFESTILGKDFDHQLVINGTSGNDTFRAIVTTDNGIVEVGGREYAFDASQQTSLRLLGGFGNDQLVFTGSDHKEVIELRHHSARITGTWYESLIYGMEEIHFEGGGNEDIARFYDTAGDDRFVARPFTASLSGADYHHSVSGIHRIYAYTTDGFDDATLTGARGTRDNFVAKPDFAKLYGQEFYLFVRDFDRVAANATDHTDRAYLHDSSDDDLLIGNQSEVKLSGTEYSLAANNYNYVKVNATNGGTDSAKLVGSSHRDHLKSRPSSATFDIFKQQRIVAQGFERLDVDGGGGYDVGRLFDSHYDDTFVAGPGYAELTNAVANVTMSHFERLDAQMNADSYDRAIITGTDGADLFKASPHAFQLSGSQLEIRGTGFDEVQAFGDTNDRAYLYDSAFNDLLHLTDTVATLSGQRFSNTASGFGKVNSEASTGHDRAVFLDSESRSTVRQTEQKATIFGDGYSHNVTDFDVLDAYYSDLEGRDNVELTGRINYELLASDIATRAYKLNLIVDEEADSISIQSSLNKLP